MQTDSIPQIELPDAKKQENQSVSRPMRSFEECLKIFNSNLGAAALTDDEIILLVKRKHIPTYQVEKAIDDPERGVGIRRRVVGAEGNFFEALSDLPYRNYDYSKVNLL